MKRILDCTIAVLALLMFIPIMLIIAAVARLKLGSPVLFKQKRPGLHGVPFFICKFRTMTDSRDERGDLLPDSMRLHPFGRWLRKYSLDELPQLINVIKGDLSLVGPRPLLMDYLPLYTERQARRHEVRPGITGWAQINGRNAISWEEKFELDIWYVENRSFWLDMRILGATMAKVFRSEGISNVNHATMPMFRGSGSPSHYSSES